MRALAVIFSLLASAAHALPSVALDLTALDADAFAALDGVALEKSATVRLVQDGFAVVTRTANPDVTARVEVRREPRTLILSTRGPGGEATSEVPWGTEPLVELHLELVQKLAELTRTVAKPASPLPRGKGQGEGAVPEQPPVGKSPPAPAPRDREWRISAFAGALLREGGIDPLATVSARWGVSFRLALEIGVSLSGNSERLSVREPQVSAGGAFAVRLPASLELEIAALVGGLLHHSTFTYSDHLSTSTRINLLLSLPVTLSFAFTEWFSMGVRLAVGWGQPRQHFDGETLLWSRGAVRFDFGLNFTLVL